MEEQPLPPTFPDSKDHFRSSRGGILKTVEGGLFPLYGLFDFLFALTEDLVLSDKGAVPLVGSFDVLRERMEGCMGWQSGAALVINLVTLREAKK